MISREELFAFAEERGYDVIIDDFPECGSLSIETGAIGLDRNLRPNDEKVRLAHEVAHCETGAFYSRNFKLPCIRKLENRANSWMYEKLLPFNDMQNALRNGVTEPWELAELFDLPEDVVRGAWTYYTERRGYQV